jgi:hypothetical protein
VNTQANEFEAQPADANTDVPTSDVDVHGNVNTDEVASEVATDSPDLLTQVKEAFDKLKDLIENPETVGLNLLKKALETAEGRSYIARAMANNLEFRELMQQEPEMPKPDFSNLKVTIVTERDESDESYMPARLYAEDDTIFPGRLVTFGNVQQGVQETTFLPEVEAFIREQVALTPGVVAGKVFFVSIKRETVEEVVPE